MTVSSRVIAVNLTLKAPFFEEGDELFAMKNDVVSVNWKAEDCDHSQTMCPECVGSWAQDHELVGVIIAQDDGLRTLSFEEITQIISTAGDALKDFIDMITKEDEDGSGNDS